MKTNKQNKLQLIWIILSTLAVLVLGIISHDTWVNILIGTVGMFYVSLYTTGNRYNFIVGTVYVLLYTIICLANKIYLDAIQNVVLIPMYIISFIRWGKHKTTPKNLDWKENLLSVAGTFAMFGILFGVSKIMGGNYSYLDALNTACTLTAMLLGIWGCSIVWVYWTINNISSAIIFILAAFTPTGSVAVAAMKVIFVINGIIGLISFVKKGKQQKCSNTTMQELPSKNIQMK